MGWDEGAEHNKEQNAWPPQDIQMLMKQIGAGQSNHRRVKHKWREWDTAQQGK